MLSCQYPSLSASRYASLINKVDIEKQTKETIEKNKRAMTEEELKDICLCGETTKVQFKESPIAQKDAAREMIAFANTKGGTMLFGVEDKTGEIKGLTYEEIQQMSSELGNAANEQVKPAIYIETEVVCVDGKHVLACAVAEGRNKPYKNLQGEIWVKQGADKRRITENAEILGLFQNSGSYHPEEDAEKGTSVKDLDMPYVRDYFEKTYGKEIEDFDQPLENLLQSLSILTSKGEVTRVGMLYFGKKPQLHEPSVVVKAVVFAGNDIGDTRYIDSRDIVGTLPRMFEEGMSFLKSYLRHEQEGQNFNSLGVLEIPEVALEELLQNALVHFDLLHNAAIRLLIFNDRIEIINPGCLYGGLSVDDIKLGVSRQRNPLMAGFAAKTMIYRGLGSGIKRVIREAANIDFDNQESGNQFKVTIWRTTETTADTTETPVGTTETTTETSADTTETTASPTETTTETPASTTETIYKLICKNPKITAKKIASACGITEDGVAYQIRKLKKAGRITRVGGSRNGGEWKVKKTLD